MSGQRVNQDGGGYQSFSQSAAFGGYFVRGGEVRYRGLWWWKEDVLGGRCERGWWGVDCVLVLGISYVICMSLLGCLVDVCGVGIHCT